MVRSSKLTVVIIHIISLNSIAILISVYVYVCFVKINNMTLIKLRTSALVIFALTLNRAAI
jgi:hypothetical protein